MGNQSHRDARLLLNLQFPDSVELQELRLSSSVSFTDARNSTFHTFQSFGGGGEAGVVNFARALL